MGREMKVKLSELDAARIDRLDRDAEAVETHLYGPGAHLLSKEQRVSMKASLASIYADMGRSLDGVAARARSNPPKEGENGE